MCFFQGFFDSQIKTGSLYMDVLSGRGIRPNVLCLKVIHMQIDRLVSYHVHVHMMVSRSRAPTGISSRAAFWEHVGGILVQAKQCDAANASIR